MLKEACKRNNKKSGWRWKVREWEEYGEIRKKKKALGDVRWVLGNGEKLKKKTKSEGWGQWVLGLGTGTGKIGENKIKDKRGCVVGALGEQCGNGNKRQEEPYLLEKEK